MAERLTRRRTGKRIALGDRLFTPATWRAGNALRPRRRLVAIAAEFRFQVNNAYTLSPDRYQPWKRLRRRLGARTDTQFATDPASGRRVPVVGARDPSADASCARLPL